MKEGIFKIIENKQIAPEVFEMKLIGDISEIKRPGQFVNIKLAGKFLRRPISVCDLSEISEREDNNEPLGMLTLVYKVVGGGTSEMSQLKEGTPLSLLTGLGNGYDLEAVGHAPLLIGGGAGVPPMYYLARCLIAQGKAVTVILGFNSASEVFYEEKFRQLGAEVILTTIDGSCGQKGFVTDALAPLKYSDFCACGPEPMLKAVCRVAKTTGQLSFEERMGCGFGACMGCSCRTLTGYKRICKDGPVMKKEEILWED